MINPLLSPETVSIYFADNNNNNSNQLVNIKSFVKLMTEHCYNSSFVLLLFPVGLWLFLIETGIFPHAKRGFYCDDKSISMRFTGDTISTGLMILSIAFVYPILWICEACYFVPVSLKSSRFTESAGRAWIWFKEYLFGVILHLFIVDGLKVI